MTMMKFLVASAILAVASAQKGIPAACTDICEPVMDTCMTAAAMSNPECADCKECLTTNKGGSGKGGSTGHGSGKGSKRSGGKGGKRASGSATGGTASMKPTMHKQCASNHRLVKTAYTNRVQAFMACVKAPGAACQGVYDLGCSARGPFYICGSNSSTTKDDAMTGSANGCVYPMALVKKAAQMMGSHGGKRGSKRSTGSAGKGGKRSTGTTGKGGKRASGSATGGKRSTGTTGKGGKRASGSATAGNGGKRASGNTAGKGGKRAAGSATGGKRGGKGGKRGAATTTAAGPVDAGSVDAGSTDPAASVDAQN